MTIDAIKERDYNVAMPEYDYAFWNAVKRKPHNAKELEKASSNEAGTYLPLQANSKMNAALKRESVFRSLATIAYMREPGGIVLAKYYDTESCWVPEHGMYTFSENPGEFTEYNIKAHKLGTLLKYDEAFMVDVGLNMENHLIDNIAKSFGAMEDAAYVNGKGDIQPTGILHNTRGAQVGTTTADLTYEDVVKLYFSVKPEYRKRGVWMMNDETAYYLRTIKDEGGNYIWNHNNNTILGKPVYICNDMPGVGPGNKPIAFGDFSYYWIIIRDDVSVKVLKELYYDDMQIGYIAREYLDAKLIRPEAIKVIQMS